MTAFEGSGDETLHDEFSQCTWRAPGCTLDVGRNPRDMWGASVLDVLVQFNQSVNVPQRVPRSSNAALNAAMGGELNVTGLRMTVLSTRAISEPESASGPVRSSAR